MTSPVEIEEIRPERAVGFRREHEREALSTLWDFRVVWHARHHDVAATVEGEIVGVAGILIAASLVHVESLIVALAYRRRKVGTALLEHVESLGKYYNCHKVTLEVPTSSIAQKFFKACDYKTEATLSQHTWKRDVAIMRKFLL